MKKLIYMLTAILGFVALGPVQAGPMTLVTSEEGALKEAPSGLYDVGRSFNDGPDIRIVSPELNDKYAPPVKVEILFIPTNGNAVDLSKLKVEYLKLFTVDLTDRVKPFTSKEGIKIEKAELPSGKHTLRVTVGDVKGGMTQETFVVTLK